MDNTIKLPCKIGDAVWGIRNYKGVKHPQQGFVSEMFFRESDMALMIVVKNICRGEFGKTVFKTFEEAEERIRNESTHR